MGTVSSVLGFGGVQHVGALGLLVAAASLAVGAVSALTRSQPRAAATAGAGSIAALHLWLITLVTSSCSIGPIGSWGARVQQVLSAECLGGGSSALAPDAVWTSLHGGVPALLALALGVGLTALVLRRGEAVLRGVSTWARRATRRPVPVDLTRGTRAVIAVSTEAARHDPRSRHVLSRGPPRVQRSALPA